jgi:antitoxin VapB
MERDFLESYTMSLNVKDPEAHRLAKAIADTTGQSLTRVVTDALRDRLAKIEQSKRKASVDELLAIAARCAIQIKQPYADHGRVLYGEDGLPQ